MPETTGTALVLVPHPDDAEFYAGGLIARLAAGGWRVTLVTTTDGRKGSFTEAEDDLVRIRAEEARQGGKIMGVEQVIFLGHPDGGLDALPPGALREQFIRLIRTHRPRLVIAQDPYYPGETHPDHRACAWAATEAIRTAFLPLIHPEQRAEGLEPHAIAEKYYYTSAGSPRANRIEDTSRTIEVKVAALRAHRSQMQFLVQEILDEARQAGLDPDSFMAAFGNDRGEAMGWFIRSEDAQTGQAAGFAYGEAYHYERYHPAVEMALAQQDHPNTGE